MRKSFAFASILVWMTYMFVGLMHTNAYIGTAYADTNAVESTQTDEEDSDTLMLLLSGVLAAFSRNAIDDDITTLTFNGSTVLVEGSGVTVCGSVVTITSAGTYNISGILNDGQLVVDTDDEETVELVLKGVNITNTDGAPLYVSSAEKTVITLKSGTQNILTDGNDYVFPDGEDEPDAALFSKDDLVIEGDGELRVNANYKNGITSKDNLQINSGVVTVTAAKHAIKGKDSITILDGTFILNAGSDGMQSDNDEDADKGFITISGGMFDITSAADGIQAETTLSISDGDFTILAGGGSGVTTEDSAKGLKAGVMVNVSNGMFNINTADDAIHSNSDITIDNGSFTLATADDGIHADGTVTINGGNITITQSYEAIEGVVIIINDGDMDLTADDDGINIAGGNDEPIIGSGYYLNINGGYIVVNAAGDGLDANGDINMTDGVVLVNGPTTSANGALDYDGDFTMSGGCLVAAGSSGMAQAPSNSSTQYSVLVNLSTAQSAGELFHIQTQAGEEIMTFAPLKIYQSVVFSLPKLTKGTTYAVYIGGSSTGTVTDGLYTGGTYTPGTQVTGFTISSIITMVGAGPSPY